MTDLEGWFNLTEVSTLIKTNLPNSDLRRESYKINLIKNFINRIYTLSLPQAPKKRPQGETAAKELFIILVSIVPSTSPFKSQIFIFVSRPHVIINLALQDNPILMMSALWTCGKSGRLAGSICKFVPSSFLLILKALIVFPTPKPVIKDLQFDWLNFFSNKYYDKIKYHLTCNRGWI